MSDALEERLAGVLIAHESFGGGWFCRCTPEDENGSREPLPVSWEQHLVEKQAEAVEQEIAAARAEAWGEGYTSGHSNAMRRMSDEPDAPTTPNPYRKTTPTTDAAR